MLLWCCYTNLRRTRFVGCCSNSPKVLSRDCIESEGLLQRPWEPDLLANSFSLQKGRWGIQAENTSEVEAKGKQTHSPLHTHLPTQHHNPSSPTVFFFLRSSTSRNVNPLLLARLLLFHYSRNQKKKSVYSLQEEHARPRTLKMQYSKLLLSPTSFLLAFFCCFQGAATIQLQKPTLFQRFIVLRKMKKKKPKKKKNQTLPNLQKISPWKIFFFFFFFFFMQPAGTHLSPAA